MISKKAKNFKFTQGTHCNKPKYLYVNVEQNEQGKITNDFNILFTVIKDKGEFSPKKLLGALQKKKKNWEQNPV